jgi:hypothetical protein
LPLRGCHAGNGAPLHGSNSMSIGDQYRREGLSIVLGNALQQQKFSSRVGGRLPLSAWNALTMPVVCALYASQLSVYPAL